MRPPVRATCPPLPYPAPALACPPRPTSPPARTHARQILAVAGGRSLVLLDEVGSGTDPLEGAALARAVLDRLAGQVGDKPM